MNADDFQAVVFKSTAAEGLFCHWSVHPRETIFENDWNQAGERGLRVFV